MNIERRSLDLLFKVCGFSWARTKVVERQWRSAPSVRRVARPVPAVAFALVLGLLLAAANLPAQAQTYGVLYTFMGGTDGAVPYAGLIHDAAGNFYGTTVDGGAYGAGTVYKVDRAGKETVLYSFTGGSDGGDPVAGLLRDAAGNLYGTTDWGGDTSCNPPYGCGTVFELEAGGGETVLYAFEDGVDGANPFASLVRDAEGNLYGTTIYGGVYNEECYGYTFGCGIVFKVDMAGKETILYSFTGGTDGGSPFGSLITDSAGNLYGTTWAGGTYGYGTVFKLDRIGKETVLYSFAGGTDGSYPTDSLIRDSAGNLYGTTDGSGDCLFGCGTVFELDTTGKETVLYRFAGGTDGSGPYAGLIRDAQGNPYGTTVYGGQPDCAYGSQAGCGTVFELDSAGQETVLYAFPGGSGGTYPRGGLLLGPGGILLGTASAGGALNHGVVFALKP